MRSGSCVKNLPWERGLACVHVHSRAPYACFREVHPFASCDRSVLVAQELVAEAIGLARGARSSELFSAFSRLQKLWQLDALPGKVNA